MVTAKASGREESRRIEAGIEIDRESRTFMAMEPRRHKMVKTKGNFYPCRSDVIKKALICFNQLCFAEGLPKDCVCLSVMDGDGKSDKARPSLKGVQFPRKCMVTRLIEHCKW